MGVSRWQKKKKEWNNRNRMKQMRKLMRKKKNHYSLPNGKEKKKKNRDKPYYLNVPTAFSLSDNINETVSFFKTVFDNIKKCKKGNKLFFDLSKVEIVTPDAIMYLIAVINNSKQLRVLNISCGGNVPDNIEARLMLEKVGFYDYVKAKESIKPTKDSDRIKILSGYESCPEITSKICDFVIQKIDSGSMKTTKRLYPMLVEMMNNVKQHAYNDKKCTMRPKWYIYVENRDRDIKFIFLDSGSGIPNTIRKNWTEKLRRFFGGVRDEPDYIEAALRGEFRTETKMGHRGKGLPEIYDAVINKTNRLSKMEILSGHARCNVSSDSIKKEFIENSFEGSLFMWNYLKGEIV